MSVVDVVDLLSVIFDICLLQYFLAVFFDNNFVSKKIRLPLILLGGALLLLFGLCGQCLFAHDKLSVYLLYAHFYRPRFICQKSGAYPDLCDYRDCSGERSGDSFGSLRK